jgi:hypothetical protein
MNFSSRHLDITDHSELMPNCYYFKFKGKFTEEASIAGGQAWDLAFAEDNNNQYHLIWDGSEMSGFDVGARKEWYKAVKRNMYKISDVTVISYSVFVRGAVRVMLESFGIKYRMISAINELATLEFDS